MCRVLLREFAVSDAAVYHKPTDSYECGHCKRWMSSMAVLTAGQFVHKPDCLWLRVRNFMGVK